MRPLQGPLAVVAAAAITLTAIPTADAQSAPPAWVDVDTGAVRKGGKRLAIAVARAKGSSDEQSARSKAAAKARGKISGILLDKAAPKAKAGASHVDDMFADMNRTEVKIAIDRAAIDGVEIAGVYEPPGSDEAYVLASVPETDLVAALDSLPLDPDAKAAARRNIDKELDTMEKRTEISAEELPDSAATAFRKRGKQKPGWVEKGCGTYKGKRGKTWYGVGLVSGLTNRSLATSTADNRARAEIGMCVGFKVERTASGVKLTSTQTLWGVTIVDHWFGPDGTVYSLAEVPDSMLPSPDEKKALIEQMRRPPAAKAAPAPASAAAMAAMAAPAKSKPHACSTRGKRGTGLNIVLGIIGSEAEVLEGAITRELNQRGFRVLGASDRGKPHGQLVLKVGGTYTRSNKALERCIIDVEFIKGTETLNKGTYGCVVEQDRDAPMTVAVRALRDHAHLIKCSVADNLWLAAQKAKRR